jgi:hypothetical protein
MAAVTNGRDLFRFIQVAPGGSQITWPGLDSGRLVTDPLEVSSRIAIPAFHRWHKWDLEKH